MDLRAIFLAGMDKADLAQRQAFIADACGTDTDLRGQVESLFRAHDRFAEAPRSPDPTPRPLPQLGPYRLLEVLGKGGMGVVYLAEDQQLGRKVAVKVLLPMAAASPGAHQRFLREARSAAGIDSDHVVPIYQVGEDQGVPYLVMPFLRGESLDRWLAQGRECPVPRILRLGQQIARGLEAAHARGLIHRDIKPANVWLEAGGGRARILDFGLARAVEDSARLTQSGHVVGTPAYMAPEQALGEKIDHRCDLYSLGALLYHVCTGQPPFPGQTSAAVLTALMLNTPRPVGQLNPALPRELADLVMQLLAKDPAQRPGSAAEVVERLEAIERGEERPAASTPAMPVPVTKAPTRRRRGLAVAGALLLAAGFSLATWLLVGPPKGEGSTTAADVTDAKVVAPQVDTRRVKVFLLAGQSNMSGRAPIRTLARLAATPEDRKLLARLKDPDGKEWAVRKDVHIYYPRESGLKKGPLTVGYGEKDEFIGPELMFGHVIGDHYENPVLLLKVTQGGLSIGIEGRPPSSGGVTGPYYKRLVWTTKEVLANLPSHFPEYAGREYELAGLVWCQGWNDHIFADRLQEYEFNLVNFINDLRKDLGLPRLPTVIAEIGVDGDRPGQSIRSMREIQARVAARREYAGTVALGETVKNWDKEAEAVLQRGYVNRKWIDKETQDHFETMGSDLGYHYLGSGKTFVLNGQSFAEAMKKLCAGK